MSTNSYLNVFYGFPIEHISTEDVIKLHQHETDMFYYTQIENENCNHRKEYIVFIKLLWQQDIITEPHCSYNANLPCDQVCEAHDFVKKMQKRYLSLKLGLFQLVTYMECF